MEHDREREVRTWGDRPSTVEGDRPESSRAAIPRGHLRLTPGTEPPKSRGGIRWVLLACLAWFLATVGLLALLDSVTPRERTGPPGRLAPATRAFPEGPGRHQ